MTVEEVVKKLEVIRLTLPDIYRHIVGLIKAISEKE